MKFKVIAYGLHTINIITNQFCCILSFELSHEHIHSFVEMYDLQKRNWFKAWNVWLQLININTTINLDFSQKHWVIVISAMFWSLQFYVVNFCINLSLSWISKSYPSLKMYLHYSLINMLFLCLLSCPFYLPFNCIVFQYFKHLILFITLIFNLCVFMLERLNSMIFWTIWSLMIIKEGCVYSFNFYASETPFKGYVTSIINDFLHTT